MAYVVKSNGKNFAFGVSQAVGHGKSNLWTDCMLVLYLAHRRAVYSLGFPSDIGVPTFDPNMDYTNITLVSKVILGFQTIESKRGFHLKKDGKVNCPPNWFTGSKLFTIQQMNLEYQAAVITHFNNRVDPIELALDDYKMHPILRGQLIASAVFEDVL